MFLALNIPSLSPFINTLTPCLFPHYSHTYHCLLDNLHRLIVTLFFDQAVHIFIPILYSPIVYLRIIYATLTSRKKAALTRVRKIKGQILALETALENENECGQVLQQIAAIRGAINGLMAGVLESHLREGLMDAVASPEDQKNSVDDAISLIRTYLR